MRIIFIILVVCLHYSEVLAQCPEVELILSSQKQVNDFGLENSHCRRIDGDVVIGIPYGKTDITDLTPLKQVRHIGGSLNILNNPELHSLDGLENLQSIGGYLNIFHNEPLEDVDGLKSLISVGGNLWIINNSSLTSLEGLRNLQSIDGSIDVWRNASLASVEGLENIDPGSVKATLDYCLVQLIDVRVERNNISTEEGASLVHVLTKKNPVEQFQKLMNKPYSKRAVETDLLYQSIKSISDSVEAHGILDELTDISHDSKDREMIWEVKLLKCYWQLKNGSASLPQRIALMETLAGQAGREQMFHMAARALKFISYKYFLELREYNKIIQNCETMEQMLDHLSPEEFPDMAGCYLSIGKAHYFFKDYNEAIRYFRNPAALPKNGYNASHVLHAINNLGLCYQKLNHLDTSDYYFTKILKDTVSYPVEVWAGIASGNLGHNHYFRGEYQKAIPLLQRDIYNAISLPDWGLAAGSLMPLADIRLKQNDLEEAKRLIDQARKYIYKTRQTVRLRLLFPILSKWYAAMGQKDKVADYIDSTEQVLQEYNDKIQELKLLRFHQESSAKLHINQMKSQQFRQQRDFVVVIIFLFFIGTSMFFWYRNKNIKRKQELHELELKNAQESLENARSRLTDQARKIRENDKMIHQFQQEFKGRIDPPALQELKSSTILTRADWVSFKKNFQKVYPGILSTLRTSYPDLTPAELRLLCLLKLGLTNREMATAQGVSLQSIYVTNHRIRKKLGLENQDKLEELVREMK